MFASEAIARGLVQEVFVRWRALAAVFILLPSSASAIEDCDGSRGDDLLICVCEQVWMKELRGVERAAGTEVLIRRLAEDRRQILFATEEAGGWVTCDIGDDHFVGIGWSGDSLLRITPDWPNIEQEIVNRLNALVLKRRVE